MDHAQIFTDNFSHLGHYFVKVSRQFNFIFNWAEIDLKRPPSFYFKKYSFSIRSNSNQFSLSIVFRFPINQYFFCILLKITNYDVVLNAEKLLSSYFRRIFVLFLGTSSIFTMVMCLNLFYVFFCWT